MRQVENAALCTERPHRSRQKCKLRLRSAMRTSREACTFDSAAVPSIDRPLEFAGSRVWRPLDVDGPRQHPPAELRIAEIQRRPRRNPHTQRRFGGRTEIDKRDETESRKALLRLALRFRLAGLQVAGRLAPHLSRAVLDAPTDFALSETDSHNTAIQIRKGTISRRGRTDRHPSTDATAPDCS